MKYVVLIDFTEEGLRAVGNSPQRAAAFRSHVESVGGTVIQVYWTLGRHDGILTMDVPDEASAAAALLNLDRGGYVHAEAMRAFDAHEFETVLEKIEGL
ncbi:MAG: GYD domain-containing protein [Verrucomicrobia bacterium]|nr:GYD domain-containing protein [Verrucomicrobiota bacterium]MDA1086232.1 GYD domain-containing protein [Verrucomicrobiota bacterium]